MKLYQNTDKNNNPIIANVSGETLPNANTDWANIITAGGNSFASIWNAITGQTPTNQQQQVTLEKSNTSYTWWVVGGLSIVAVIIFLAIFFKNKK